MEQKPKRLLVTTRIVEPLLQMVEGSFGETDRWQHCWRLAYDLADSLSIHDERLAELVRDLGGVCALAPAPTQQDVDKAFEEGVRKMLHAVNNWLELERMDCLKQLAVAAAAVSKAYVSGRSLASHSRNLDFKGNAHEIRVFAQAISGRSAFVSDTDMLRCLFTADAVTSVLTLALNEFWLGELVAACCKASLDRDRRIFPLDTPAIAGAMIELERRYSSGICNSAETHTASYARALIDGLLMVGGTPRQETVIENPIFAARFAYRRT